MDITKILTSALQSRIFKEIAAVGGWLPFDRFMELALYAPGLGYYANETAKFGTMPDSGSDFVTAPEISPIFGQLVASQLREALQKTNTHEIWEFGAGTGALALQILDELAAQGAIVIGTATSESGARAIGERLAAHGGHGRALDVADAGAVEVLVEAISKEFGSISILVNNAGITRDNLLMRMKEEDWQAILDTNLTSVYRTSKAVMRGMMKARKGRIINIASVIGVTGNAGQANYAAAKAGIIAFSKSLAKEIGSRGVTVNVVAPGFIDTDMTKDLPEDAKTAMLGQIALGRLGEPADIARAVAFLAGPDAGYITGETLHVNGGMYMA